jgi:dihydroorotase
MKYSLVIKGARVVDPSQGLDAVRDVAFAGGKVAAVAPSLATNEAEAVLEAAGLIAVPGLVDLHFHTFWGVSHYGVDPDHINISKGVTTAVDAGTSGAHTFPAFRRHVIERAHTRLFALLNIASGGMISPKIGELTDLRWADVEDAVNVARQHRNLILGIKARLARPLAGDNDAEAMKRALEAASAFGGFVMVHVGNTRTPLEQLVAKLRPGDVVTHTFHGLTEGILDDAGRVKDAILDAQKRGVIFDVGHGAGSFSFRVAEKALAQGFFPGNVSSDLHRYNVDGPVFDQVTTLSKFLHMGMPLPEVVRLSTAATA